MARIRKACAYRVLERPYTRISKFRKKSYIRAKPNSTLIKFDMGTQKKSFSHNLNLVSK